MEVVVFEEFSLSLPLTSDLSVNEERKGFDHRKSIRDSQSNGKC